MYDPPCEFCDRLDNFDEDPKLKTISEDLEKLPGLVEEVCKLHEELEQFDISLNSSFDLDEIFSYKPTCCETSIVNSIGKFCLNKVPNRNSF